MDEYKLTLIKKTGQLNITGLSSNLTWRDSLDSLGMELGVDIARSSLDKYVKQYDIIEVGDKIILQNKDKEVFRGIIVDLGTEEKKKTIKAFDYAFYLNKSKTIIQFKKMKADAAIKQLCSKFGVPVGKIAGISTPITKIYKNDTISDIIKDILEQATKELGIKYRLEMTEGRLTIDKYASIVIKPKYQPARNLDYLNPLNAIGKASRSESIADMKNSIQISSGNEKSVRVVATAKDEANIAKYGLLQEVESVDDKDKGKANNIAKNKLKELNKVKDDLSITILGDDRVRAGRVLSIDEPSFKLKGNYLVKECTHSYQNLIHTMDLKLEKED